MYFLSIRLRVYRLIQFIWRIGFIRWIGHGILWIGHGIGLLIRGTSLMPSSFWSTFLVLYAYFIDIFFNHASISSKQGK